MSSYFRFNGVDSRDMGLTVERIPTMRSPKKRIESIHIAGRNGALHQSDGSYENYTQAYQCWFSNPEDANWDFATQVHLINEWLGAAPAGAELRDSYDPQIYRLATYIGGVDIQNFRNIRGRFTVRFDCDPRGFYPNREIEAVGRESIRFVNPTEHTAKPLIKLESTAGASIVFSASKGETTLRSWHMYISPDDDLEHTIYIDCDIQEAWEVVDGVTVNRSQWITLEEEEFPEFWPGQNGLMLSKGYALIDPRWWTL